MVSLTNIMVVHIMNNEIDCFNKFVQRVWRSNSAETMMVDRGEEQSESLDEHELQCLVGFQGLSLGPLILWIRQGIRKMSLQCWIIHFRLNLSLTSNAMVLCFPNLILMSQYYIIIARYRVQYQVILHRDDWYCTRRSFN